MANRAFRLLLCLSSIYVACVTILNVFVGSFNDNVNISLLSTGLFTLLQIVNLITLYKYNHKMIKVAFVSEGLLILSSVWSMIVFPYVIGQLIFGIIIALLTTGLLFVASKDLTKRENQNK